MLSNSSIFIFYISSTIKLTVFKDIRGVGERRTPKLTLFLILPGRCSGNCLFKEGLHFILKREEDTPIRNY